MADNEETIIQENVNKPQEVSYSTEKDFYKGIGGELRFKAEGLFKKAKEKDISIEEIVIEKIRNKKAIFPGIGEVDLPAYVVQVKGRYAATGQIIADGKQIDYYNRYQKYLSDKILEKNTLKDEKGRIIRQNGKPLLKDDADFSLSDWDLFIIGKSLIDDKEFGMEKTITGACDRVIRKLMGENDWLYPEEARLLDEEFESVKSKIEQNRDNKEKSVNIPIRRRATERQINFLKSKIRNLRLDPENQDTIKEFIKQSGFQYNALEELSVYEISKIIDEFASIAQKVKNTLSEPVYKQTVQENNLIGFSNQEQNVSYE